MAKQDSNGVADQVVNELVRLRGVLTAALAKNIEDGVASRKRTSIDSDMLAAKRIAERLSKGYYNL